MSKGTVYICDNTETFAVRTTREDQACDLVYATITHEQVAHGGLYLEFTVKKTNSASSTDTVYTRSVFDKRDLPVALTDSQLGQLLLTGRTTTFVDVERDPMLMDIRSFSSWLKDTFNVHEHFVSRAHNLVGYSDMGSAEYHKVFRAFLVEFRDSVHPNAVEAVIAYGNNREARNRAK